MAESLAQRLQRIAREKAASAAGGASAPVAQPTQVTQAQVTEEVSDEQSRSVAEVSASGTCAGTGAIESSSTPVTDVEPDSVGGAGQDTSASSEVESNKLSDSDGVLSTSVSSSTAVESVAATPATEPSSHPLAMAFAELEAGLLARDPEFKTKLRDIHRHLGREPELVTQMSEAEIALIVTGMVVFANAEIVEPAAKKAGKAAVKAASKVVISADDL